MTYRCPSVVWWYEIIAKPCHCTVHIVQSMYFNRQNTFCMVWAWSVFTHCACSSFQRGSFGVGALLVAEMDFDRTLPVDINRSVPRPTAGFPSDLSSPNSSSVMNDTALTTTSGIETGMTAHLNVCNCVPTNVDV
jgi:hypothetical protein